MQSVIQAVMIHDGIARIGHAQSVDGGEVEHVVAALLGHSQTGLPVGQRAEQLDEVRLTRHRIQGQGGAIDCQLGHHQEIATAGGGGTGRIEFFSERNKIVLAKGNLEKNTHTRRQHTCEIV